MPRKNRDGKFILSAGEIGSYTLCPEAWRLSLGLEREKQQTQRESVIGEELHASWAKGHDEVLFLTFGVKLLIALIVGLLVWYLLFLRYGALDVSPVTAWSSLVRESNREVALLALLLLAMLLVLSRIITSLETRRGESGLSGRANSVSVDGSKALPVRDYVSDMQGIAGRPDAVISERGFLIPVERKPLARKIRDRYVAQLLAYMRLIEEFEGKRPPYGYLILGPSCRKITIENTPERQQWLQGIIDEMRGILEGKPARPEPHPKKCERCTVREHCDHRVGNGRNSHQGEGKVVPIKIRTP